jgi:hypothetical protein
MQSNDRRFPKVILALSLALTLGCATSGGAFNDRSVPDLSESAPATDGKAADAIISAEIAVTPAFPIRIRPGARILEDSAGRAFLLHGDTAWSLIAQLKQTDVDLYLEDRRARGFNAILVNLIEHKFSSNAPDNAYGHPPFLTPGDFATPNELYFAHADWVLRRAAEKGFLVLLVPSYLGAGGSEEGWYQEMVGNGPAKLRQYGRYLGHRYRGFVNILWVQGGDFNPPNKDLVRAIANGIRELDDRVLQTAHCVHETAALEYWQGEPWLQVNTVYTYEPVYSASLEQYSRRERLPFFVIESAYEGGKEYASLQRVRAQAYHAVLTGAAGQVFGNNPVWHYDGPGIRPMAMTWQQAMQSPGAQSMTQLRKLFEGLSWWTLEPDMNRTLLTGGFGSGQQRAVAARAADGSFAILYVPRPRQVTLNLGRLAGPKLIARWYDPSTGQFSQVDGSPFAAAGSRRFRQNAKNGSGFSDWVLLLQSQP